MSYNSKLSFQKNRNPFSNSDIEDALRNINPNNFSSCPFCDGKNIIRNGKTRLKRQRYICKNCGKSFSEMTGSPFMYSKKSLGTWVKYIFCMTEKLTLRETAGILKVNLTTSFLWRHKILSVAGTTLKDSSLLDTIEIHELKVTENFKGNHRKRPAPLINNRDFVIVLSCMDTGENKLFKASAKNRVGRLDRADLDKALAPLITGGKIIATPRNNTYVNFAKTNNLTLCMVGSYSYSIKGINAKKAENQSRSFKKFLFEFSGVASKYISYYINLFKLQIEDEKNKAMNLVNKFSSGKRQLRVFEFDKVQFDGSLTNL